jgi:hypothetical protein
LDTYLTGKKRKIVGKPDGKKPPARSMGKWEDITMYLSQIGLEGVANIHLVQDRGKLQDLVYRLMNFRVP